MSIYLVDFENVTSEGLRGVAQLKEEDRVILFYSANAHKISLSVHRAICHTKAKVNYFEVAVGGKNALDHQLSTFLGYLIGNNQNMQYFIVSKDRGYEYLSEFWKNIGIVSEDIHIKRIDSIKIATPVEALSEENDKQIIVNDEETGVNNGDDITGIEKPELVNNLEDTIVQEDKTVVQTEDYIDNTPSKVVDIKRIDSKKVESKKRTSKKQEEQKDEINSIKTKSNNRITNKASSGIVGRSEGVKSTTIKNKTSKREFRKGNKGDIFARDIRRLIGEELDEKELQKIIECFKISSTKQELHIKIIGVLGRQRGPQIYNKIKGLMAKVEKNATIEVDIRGIIDTSLKEEELKEVVECFRQSNSKQELHVKVIGALGREKGPEIYNKIKRLMSKIS